MGFFKKALAASPLVLLAAAVGAPIYLTYRTLKYVSRHKLKTLLLAGLIFGTIKTCQHRSEIGKWLNDKISLQNYYKTRVAQVEENYKTRLVQTEENYKDKINQLEIKINELEDRLQSKPQIQIKKETVYVNVTDEYFEPVEDYLASALEYAKKGDCYYKVELWWAEMNAKELETKISPFRIEEIERIYKDNVKKYGHKNLESALEEALEYAKKGDWLYKGSIDNAKTYAEDLGITIPKYRIDEIEQAYQEAKGGGPVGEPEGGGMRIE